MIPHLFKNEVNSRNQSNFTKVEYEDDFSVGDFEPELMVQAMNNSFTRRMSEARE